MIKVLHSENQKKLSYYEAYLQQLEQLQQTDKVAPYGWVVEPNEISGIWLLYFLPLREFARELANEINYLGDGIRRITAWAQIVKSLNDDQKLEVQFEFIKSLGTHMLQLPYAIKSKFAYSVAHLSHQANRTFGGQWLDQITSEDTIHLNAADEYAKRWKAYRKLKLALEAIDASDFKKKTVNFRNAFSHRFPVSLVYGHTGFLERKMSGSAGGVSYSLSEHKPLELDDIVVLLKREHDLCIKGFERFQLLVVEQIGAIAVAQKVQV